MYDCTPSDSVLNIMYSSIYVHCTFFFWIKHAIKQVHIYAQLGRNFMVVYVSWRLVLWNWTWLLNWWAQWHHCTSWSRNEQFYSRSEVCPLVKHWHRSSSVKRRLATMYKWWVTKVHQLLAFFIIYFFSLYWQVLLDTQRRAVNQHGVDPLNLWVGKFVKIKISIINN